MLNNDALINMDKIDEISLSKSQFCYPEECPSLISGANSQIKILSQNIRSISCNMPGFHTLLARMETEPDVIVLTECWLSQTSNLPSIINYTSSQTLHNPIQNDGVVVYIKNNIESNSYEPSFSDANCLVTAVNKTTTDIYL